MPDGLAVIRREDPGLGSICSCEPNPRKNFTPPFGCVANKGVTGAIFRMCGKQRTWVGKHAETRGCDAAVAVWLRAAMAKSRAHGSFLGDCPGLVKSN